MSALAEHLTGLLKAREKGWNENATAAVAGLFDALDQGHTCLDGAVDEKFPGMVPSLRELGGAFGNPGDYTPLILEGERLYFARYWKYEHDVAARLMEMTEPEGEPPDESELKRILSALFPKDRDRDQASAVIAACVRKLVVITGGPGTGKTTTVAKILAARQMLAGGRPLTIRLAAYTGKAADRLKQSIAAVKPSLGLTPEIVKSIPEDASTIHRLMGMSQNGRLPARNAGNPLALDLLVLDEASMIDLSMLSKVLDALPASAGLILLGDKDQLHAVQPGSVFGDICSATGHSQELYGLLGRLLGEKLAETPAHGALRDNLFTLTKSFRFKSDSGIGLLARAINEGDGEGAVAVLKHDPSHEILWHETTTPGGDPALESAVVDWLIPYFTLVIERKSEREIFEAFNRFRLLTPLRNGPDDVVTMNERILDWIKKGTVRPAELQGGGRVPEWYPGRPVIINENNYALGLFNGDIGIALQETDGTLSVVFPGEGDVWRRFSPGRLPSHETAYACTVHKSQGSEFENVFLLIPEGENPVVTRNLLYTGVTRARKRCLLWGSEAGIRAAIMRKPRRASGLASRLSGGENSLNRGTL